MKKYYIVFDEYERGISHNCNRRVRLYKSIILWYRKTGKNPQ